MTREVTPAQPLTLERVVMAAAETAVRHRDLWDGLDAAAADGDFGTTMSRGFGAILEERPAFDDSTPRSFLTSVSEVLSREMGGSSGPLWAVGFLRAGVAFGDGEASISGAIAGLRAAINGIQEYGHAQLGDKTLLDALVPAVDALEDAFEAGEDDPVLLATIVAQAAETGARDTIGMQAARGRAAYAGDRSIGCVDPGAAAVATILARIASDARGDHEASFPEFSTSVSTERVAEGGKSDAPLPTKQLINDPDRAVIESLAAYATAHSDLVRWEPVDRILRRASKTEGEVGVIAGGGSGHEPMHAGFVGPGMLTAVAPGPVFASPTVHQILAATLAADNGAGVLHLVKNYTGDVINFGIARELAEERGTRVSTVIIDDDVGLGDVTLEVGRRGTGATVVTEKLAGAAAAAGAGLDAVAAVAQEAVANSASFGVALGSCSPPGRGPILELGPAEIEVGVGIHGEPGRRREVIKPAAEIVEEATATILRALDPHPMSTLLAFVSGLGATTLMEQYIVYGNLETQVRKAGHTIGRCLVGPYLTALDMPGILITLTVLNDELTSLWDAPVHTAGLRWGV